MKLIRYEQETIVNFNAEEPDAIVYTHDKAVMRQLQAFVVQCKLAIDSSFDGANGSRPNNKCDGKRN